MFIGLGSDIMKFILISVGSKLLATSLIKKRINDMSNLPQYTENKRKGNIGEAFVQCILSSFCLVHKIDSSQDLGNDFICELTKGKYPSNILFYVQVKYWNTEPKDSDIKDKIEYWEGSPIPTYLFWIDAENSISFDKINSLDPKKEIERLKYKRYTPIAHGNNQPKNLRFKPFRKREFLRDIMVDYARCLYKRGMSTVINKNDFTELDKAELPLGEICLFVDDVIPDEYKDEFIRNSWTNLLATAKSLYVSKPDNREYLQLALEHVQLANKMIKFGNPDYQGFKEICQKLEKDIQDGLEMTNKGR